uniref:Uncharacterized protein n=1 Tax=Nicotiana tabacum TaxID=4097 RepID=A0A1S4BCV9_TOBAC|nr:PREDICTED: uncharacterized protein LOC107806907 [Nicotiana tabacum]
MLLPTVPDEWAAKAFTKDLNPRSFDASCKLKECLLEFQVTTRVDVHNRYKSKIRIEDDQIGFPSSAKGREKNKEKSKEDFDTERRSSRGRVLPYELSEGRGRGSGRHTEYNFNVNVIELVSALRNIKEARFPKTIRSDPCQRDPNLWSKYHGTNGHRTGDYRHLGEEVAPLLKNGHLREFLSDRAKNTYSHNRDNAEPSKVGEDPPCQTINMIFGGNEINGVTFSVEKKMKVSIIHSKILREVIEDDITFTEEDADGLLLQHNDALVISLNVLDFKIKFILVDPGSSSIII